VQGLVALATRLQPRHTQQVNPIGRDQSVGIEMILQRLTRWRFGLLLWHRNCRRGIGGAAASHASSVQVHRSNECRGMRLGKAVRCNEHRSCRLQIGGDQRRGAALLLEVLRSEGVRCVFGDCQTAPTGPVFLSLPMDVMEEMTAVDIGEVSKPGSVGEARFRRCWSLAPNG